MTELEKFLTIDPIFGDDGVMYILDPSWVSLNQRMNSMRGKINDYIENNYSDDDKEFYLPIIKEIFDRFLVGGEGRYEGDQLISILNIPSANTQWETSCVEFDEYGVYLKIDNNTKNVLFTFESYKIYMREKDIDSLL